MFEASRALLLIDMQLAMARTTQPRNNPGAEDKMGGLLSAWRAARQPVVHVRHMSRSPHSPFAVGQPGAAFQPAFEPLAGEHVVEKNVPDAFAQSGLERWLRVRGIDSLVIVGVATNNSVESTARSAGNLGFSTVVVCDACFAFDKRDHDGTLRTAQEVHAMSLANLAGEYAQVLPAAALLNTPQAPITGG